MSEEDPEPRFKGLSGMGKFAELGIRIAEQSLEQQRRIEYLLTEIRDLLRGRPSINSPVFTTTGPTQSYVVTSDNP